MSQPKKKRVDPAKRPLNPREIAFLAAYLAPKSPTYGNQTKSAIKAGYPPAGASVQAARLLGKAKIQAAVSAWREKTESDAICSIVERKQILSEIARRDASDYVEGGKDGTWLTFGKESKNRRAVASIKSRTDEDGGVITELRLADPVPAIDCLNKMDAAYPKPANDEGVDEFVIRVVLEDRRDARRKEGA